MLMYTGIVFRPGLWHLSCLASWLILAALPESENTLLERNSCVWSHCSKTPRVCQFSGQVHEEIIFCSGTFVGAGQRM